jgi:xylulokinase
MAGLLGIERGEALARAGDMEPGAGGLLLLPYLSGERTPNLPTATGTLVGLTAHTSNSDALLRAALDGVAAGLAYCVEALAHLGISASGVTLVGGGAAHPAWQQAIADATGLPVTVRAGSEHAARGAALQAIAVVRDEPITEVIARWRLPVIAEVTPRAGMREAFCLDERRWMIQEQQAAVRRDARASPWLGQAG